MHIILAIVPCQIRASDVMTPDEILGSKTKRVLEFVMQTPTIQSSVLLFFFKKILLLHGMKMTRIQRHAD